MDEGNLVLADTTVLTTIVRVDELYVYFDAPERDLVEYQRSLISAQGRDPLSQEIPVEVGVTGEGAYPHAGKIDFRDNRVDTSTGTIRIRGRIPNPPENGIRLLYPGMYARVRVPKGPPTQQQVIPEDCLMTSQEGRFIYVVGKDGKVGKRLVTVGATVWKAPPTATGQAARWYAGPDTEPTKDKLKSIVAISNKERPDEPVVKPDEWVILQGLQKTRPGDQVELDSWKLTRPDEAAKK